MNYDGAPNYRWRKMYKGKTYAVTCEQLGAMVWTKEASGKLADAWWRKKLAEIEEPRRLVEAQADHLADRAAAVGVELSLLDTKAKLREAVTDEELLARALARVDELKARVMGAAEQAPAAGFDLASHAGRFLALERARGKAAGTYGDLAYYIDKLQKDCPLLQKADVRRVNESTVSGFYSWLRNDSGQAPAVQRKLWNYFRRLVRFLWAENLIQLPRNLDERIFSFDAAPKKVKTYPLADVRAMLKELPDRLRLYALLALNCGMLGVDMATMRHEELKDGRVRRKRTKTRKGENVPEVEYVLWPETLALLEKYPRTHPEYVLTSRTGTPLWKAEVKDGKKKKYDLIGLQWHRGRGEGRADKPPIPLKALRSVAATALESHPQHGRFTSLFLGHAPASVKDEHYAAVPQALFDEAVLWLRGQVLGLDEPPRGARRRGN
jgi:hypothetical protein